MARPAEGCKVYIGGLDERTTKADLEEVLRNARGVADIWVARKPPGFAFVTFNEPNDASDAVRDLDGREVLGRRIRAELSKPRRGGGGGGGGPRDRDGPRYRSRSRSRERDRDRRSRSRSPRRYDDRDRDRDRDRGDRRYDDRRDGGRDRYYRDSGAPPRSPPRP